MFILFTLQCNALYLYWDSHAVLQAFVTCHRLERYFRLSPRWRFSSPSETK